MKVICLRDLDLQPPGDRDRREKAQQLPPLLARFGVADERLQERPRKCGGHIENWTEASSRDFPELSLGKELLPEGSPAGDGPPVGAETLGQFTDTPRAGPLPHCGDEHDDGAQIDLPAQKAYGGRRSSLPATFARAAEAQASAVLHGQAIRAARS